MHFTPWPRWLRIVSIATVVLPVLRSPMISSRWPRPTGVIASIALMPVWSGSCTGLRPTMPGACTSRRRSDVARDGALAVDRLSERVDDASDQRIAHRHREDAAGRLDSVTFLDLLGPAEHDGADRVLVEVQRKAEHAAVELEQLVHRGLGQSGDARDPVTDLEDAADVGLLERRLERRDVLRQHRGDLLRVDRKFRHVVSLALCGHQICSRSWSRR